MKYLAIPLLLLIFFSCEKSLTPCDCQCEVEGKVIKKDLEKDGYSVIIEEDNYDVYYAVISIANVGSYYEDLEVGEQVLLKGKCFEQDNEHHITPNYLEKK